VILFLLDNIEKFENQKKTIEYLVNTNDSDEKNTDNDNDVQIELEPIFRSVLRIWKCPMFEEIEVTQITPHCALTRMHPVRFQNRWHPPSTVTDPVIRYERYVYSIELNGHEDTIDVDGVLCSTLGLYCGTEWGWNLCTRKTVRCIHQTTKQILDCSICDVICEPNINFNELKVSMLSQIYPIPPIDTSEQNKRILPEQITDDMIYKEPKLEMSKNFISKTNKKSYSKERDIRSKTMVDCFGVILGF